MKQTCSVQKWNEITTVYHMSRDRMERCNEKRHNFLQRTDFQYNQKKNTQIFLTFLSEKKQVSI